MCCFRRSQVLRTISARPRKLGVSRAPIARPAGHAPASQHSSRTRPRRTTTPSRASLSRAPRSALFGGRHRTKEEIRHETEEIALLERKLRLLERVVRFPLTVSLALVSVVSPFLGAHWTVPVGSAVATAVLSALGVRRHDAH
jgi:hypothetical protein